MAAFTVALRFFLYLDLMVLFGLAAFGIHAFRRGERQARAILPHAGLIAGTACLGLLLSLLGLASLVADLSGTTLLAPDRETLEVLLFETGNGTAWQWRVAALLIALAAAWLLRRSAVHGAALATLAGGVALASLAWGGHGVAGEGTFGWLRLGADIVHLLAAGIWIGALIALLQLVLRRSDTIDRAHLEVSRRALAGFSSLGMLVVGALIVTGLLNLLGTAGPAGIAALPLAPYGQLLLAKLALFAAMLGLAAGNRFRLVPRFERATAAQDQRAALAALRRSLAAETVCAIAILALVAWLGTLDPSGPA